jgi:hypothetical protein
LKKQEEAAARKRQEEAVAKKKQDDAARKRQEEAANKRAAEEAAKEQEVRGCASLAAALGSARSPTAASALPAAETGRIPRTALSHLCAFALHACCRCWTENLLALVRMIRCVVVLHIAPASTNALAACNVLV